MIGEPMRVRAFIGPWIAGILVWALVVWANGLLLDRVVAAGDVTNAVTFTWFALVLAPVLTSGVATLLLPSGLRGEFIPALLAGPPVVVVVFLFSVVVFNYGPVAPVYLIVAGVGLVTIAVVVAVLIAWVLRHKTAFPSRTVDATRR